MNWGKIVLGAAVFAVALAEPTPLGELLGVALIANGAGVKLPGLGK